MGRFNLTLLLLGLSLVMLGRSALTFPGGYIADDSVQGNADFENEIDAFMKAVKDMDYTQAMKLYLNGTGKNKNDKGVTRSLNYLWKNLLNVSSQLPIANSFKVWSSYSGYGNTFMDPDKWIQKLLNSTVGNWTDAARYEALSKAAVAEIVWLYCLREMLEFCGAVENSDGNPSAWDEAVAFFVGSKIIDDPSAESLSVYGVLQNGDGEYGTSNTARVMEAFIAGSSMENRPECITQVTVVYNIVNRAFIQEYIEYAHAVMMGGSEFYEHWAEAWGYGRALTPLLESIEGKVVYDYSEDVVQKMLNPEKGSQLFKDGSTPNEFIEDIQRNGFFEALEITDCGSQLGTYGGDDTTSFSLCSSGANVGKIIGIIIGVLLGLALLVGLLVFISRMRSSRFAVNKGFVSQEMGP